MSQRRFPTVRSLSLTVTAIAVAALFLMPAAAMAATPPIGFSFEMFTPCVSAHAPANSTVNFKWRDADGTLKAEGAAPTDAGGGWGFCTSAPGVWVEPGDRIKASEGGYTRTFVVPNFTLQVNRIDDEVVGTGPAGRTIRVCSNWAPFSDYETCHGVRVGQDGNWSFEHFIGNPRVWVYGYWTSPNGDDMTVQGQVPWLAVTLGKSAFSGGTAQRTAISVTSDGVKDGSGEALSNHGGEFGGQLVNGQGKPVAVEVGDHITSPSLSSDADWIMPQIEGSVDRVADTVSGRCWDSGTSANFVQVEILHSGNLRGRSFGDTEPDGSFTLDFHDTPPFGGHTNIVRGDRVVIACVQESSDRAQLKLVVN